jgi:predicted DNA-binding mobile mystery protein A
MRHSQRHIALARKQLDRRLSPLRNAEGLTRPPRGWIRAIRDALGMTTNQLARRLGVDQSRVVRLEQSELRDSLTLGSLRKAAQALDCTLVYALLPNRNLDEIFRGRAEQAADRQLAHTHHSMKLENQALAGQDLEAQRSRLVEDYLAGDASRLWEEP